MGWFSKAAGFLANPMTAFSAASAVGDMAFSHYEAGRQRDWEEDMSGSAIQRRMVDARAAGVNPLYALGVQGASTPSGATAQAPGAMARGVQLALQNKQVSSAVDLNTALADKAKAEASKTRSETIDNARAPGLGNWVTDKLIAEINLLEEQKGNVRSQADINRIEAKLRDLEVDKLREIYPTLVEQARVDLAAGKYGLSTSRNVAEFENSPMGQVIRYIERFLGIGSEASSIGRDVKSIRSPRRR